MCFLNPVAAAEHRNPPRGCRETFDEPEARCLAPCELGERRGGREAEEGFGGSGACFLWFLSLHEQRKKPARGAGNRN